jgi:ribosomal protein S27AE
VERVIQYRPFPGVCGPLIVGIRPQRALSMEETRCDRCGAAWLGPGALDPTAAHEVASLIRGGDRITAIRRLRDVTGLGLRDAKAVELHVTRTPGECQRCGAVLVAGGRVACPKCRSLNYDW